MYQQLPVGLSQTNDVNALLSAYNTPNPSFTTMPVTEYTPVQPIPGGSVQNSSTDNVVYNQMQVETLAETEPVPSPANPPAGEPCNCPSPAAPAATAVPVDTKKALLWAAGGLGAAFLLTQLGAGSKGSVGKKKGSMLIPLALVGGVAAWYFMTKDDTGTATTTTTTTTPATTTTPTVTDTQRQQLASAYADQPKQLTAISNADAETIKRWSLLLGMWNQQWTPQQVYSTGVDGVSPASWDNSIGKWWEKFSTANNF